MIRRSLRHRYLAQSRRVRLVLGLGIAALFVGPVLVRWIARLLGYDL